MFSGCFVEVALLHVDCTLQVFESIALVCVFVLFSDGVLMVHGSCVVVANICWSVFFSCSCHSFLWLRWVIVFNGVLVGLL